MPPSQKASSNHSWHDGNVMGMREHEGRKGMESGLATQVSGNGNENCKGCQAELPWAIK